MKILSVVRGLSSDLLNNIKGFFCKKQKEAASADVKPKRKYNKKKVTTKRRGKK